MKKIFTPPAYFIATYNIANKEVFSEYQALALPMLKKYKCKVLTLGTNIVDDIVEGDQLEMNVVLEFPSKADAQAWYRSPEYQKILSMRLESISNARAVIVEGVMPVQTFSFPSSSEIQEKNAAMLTELTVFIANAIGAQISEDKSEIMLPNDPDGKFIYLSMDHKEALIFAYFLTRKDPYLTEQNKRVYYDIESRIYSPEEAVPMLQKPIGQMKTDFHLYLTTGERETNY